MKLVVQIAGGILLAAIIAAGSITAYQYVSTHPVSPGARQVADNEAGAIGAMRTLNTACIVYQTQKGKYPASLAELGPGGADLIDQELAAGEKSGYRFRYEVRLPAPTIIDGKKWQSNVAEGYAVRGTPVEPGSTGRRGFFSYESGVVRYDNLGIDPGGGDLPL
jgi:hypothetical protein